MFTKIKTAGASMLGASLLVTSAWAADHREAPIVQADMRADIADLYAFRNPEDPSKMVLAMTVNPMSAASEATTYNFDPNVRYIFNIDNDGDAKRDRKIVIKFGEPGPSGQAFWAKFPGHVSVEGNATLPTVDIEANEAVINEGPYGIRAFAGPRDDPFFFDVVGFNRFLSGTGGFDGSDGFAGYNVSAIVIEFPIEMVSEGSSNLQIWAETDRKKVTLRRGKPGRHGNVERHRGRYKQVERMANPAINTALIPADMKDAYNVGKPKDDADDFAGSIVASLTGLGTDPDNIGILASVAVPDTIKFDLDGADGYPFGGRSLDDDVIDTLLFFIFNQQSVPDGVATNDKEFLAEFPYLASPHQP